MFYNDNYSFFVFEGRISEHKFSYAKEQATTSGQKKIKELQELYDRLVRGGVKENDLVKTLAEKLDDLITTQKQLKSEISISGYWVSLLSECDTPEALKLRIHAVNEILSGLRDNSFKVKNTAVIEEVLELTKGFMGVPPNEETILALLCKDTARNPDSPAPSLALTAMLKANSIFPSTLPCLVKMKDSPITYTRVEARPPPNSAPPSRTTRYYVRELIMQCLLSLGVPFEVKREEKTITTASNENILVHEIEFLSISLDELYGNTKTKNNSKPTGASEDAAET